MPQGRVLDRLALYGVPIAAGLITAAVLLGPGRERTATGLRVYGWIATGGSRFALRLAGMQHDDRGYRALPIDGASVDVRVGGEDVSTSESAASGGDGVVDVGIQSGAPVESVVELRVRGAGQEVVVEVEPHPQAELQVPAADWQGPDAAIGVVVSRGQLVPELPEIVTVTIKQPGEDPIVPEVTVLGGDARVPKAPREKRCAETCAFTWDVEVTARAPAVELEVVADPSSPRIARWSGSLPVVSGGLWVAPDARATARLLVRSAVPRDVAYLSLVSPSGRLWGATLPMRTAADGSASGEITLPALPEGPVTVLVSPEPTEPSAATTAWPIGSAPDPLGGIVVGGHLELLADGMPAAIAAEHARRDSVRRMAYALVLAAGLFELVYLGVRARRSRHRLHAHLTERGGDVAAAETPLPLAGLLLVSGALALAFAVLALLTAWG